MFILVTCDKPQLRRTINVSALAAQFQADPVTFEHVLEHLRDTSPPLQALGDTHDLVLSYVDRSGERIVVEPGDAVTRHPHALAYKLSVVSRRSLPTFSAREWLRQRLERGMPAAWGKWLIALGVLGMLVVVVLAGRRYLDDEPAPTQPAAAGSPTADATRTSTATTPAVSPAAGSPSADTPTPQMDVFAQLWERADRPIVEGQAVRPWLWGPEQLDELDEDYRDAQGGKRRVRYYDKARFERAGDGSITLGLLVLEMATGKMQLGDDTYASFPAANIGVAGDPDDPTAPTYVTIGALMAQPPLDDGATVTQRIDRLGNISNDPGLALWGVTAAQRVQVGDRQHQVASVFWQFLNSTAIVYQDGAFVEAPLFESPLQVAGLPITEAYWANIKVGGSYQDVLIQCFERRCLTYTPMNDAAWQVESNNAGRHYHFWRYGE